RCYLQSVPTRRSADLGAFDRAARSRRGAGIQTEGPVGMPPGRGSGRAMSRFQELLADGRPHVFDGAMGTMLYQKGVFINRCYDRSEEHTSELQSRENL